MMRILQRLWAWLDDRTGLSALIGPIASHLVPRGSTWAYVFGSATLFTFLLQVVTGIALASAYVSSTGGAYESLQFITNQAPFGNLLRGLHNFGASAMIILMGVHMIRTYLSAAYKFPREVNWLSGVVLFAVTLAMGFTGQLLRWDQDGLWSIFIATEMAGRMPVVGPQLAQFILAGQTVGAATLSRFYSFHVFFIPAIIFGFIGIHLALVLRNGISEPPKMGRPVDPKTYRAWYHDMLQREGVPFWPDAVWRDVLVGVVVIGAIFLLALLVGAPALGAAPDPTNLNTYPRPDWYFLWLFAALALLPGSIETYVIVFVPLLLGAVLILLPLLSNRGERHPLRRPWSIGMVLLVFITIGPLWLAGARSPLVARF
ncbi:MAG: cytochrome b N-terminal domain-containing protein [Caldilineaceae bacterium]